VAQNHSENTYFICTSFINSFDMNANEITFDSLPQAVDYLVNEVSAIKQLVENKQNPIVERRLPIGIDTACQIIGKAKPTIYVLVKRVCCPATRTAKNSISLKMN
jgi:hypothetical protein